MKRYKPVIEPVLNPAEARALCGVTGQTLRQWEAAGLLHPGRTPGGQRRYREAELRALLADGRGRRKT